MSGDSRHMSDWRGISASFLPEFPSTKQLSSSHMHLPMIRQYTSLIFFQYDWLSQEWKRPLQCACVCVSAMWLHKEAERSEMKRETTGQSAGTQTQLGYGGGCGCLMSLSYPRELTPLLPLESPVRGCTHSITITCVAFPAHSGGAVGKHSLHPGSSYLLRR